jgi:hypothetical protein
VVVRPNRIASILPQKITIIFCMQLWKNIGLNSGTAFCYGIAFLAVVERQVIILDSHRCTLQAQVGSFLQQMHTYTRTT